MTVQGNGTHSVTFKRSDNSSDMAAMALPGSHHLHKKGGFHLPEGCDSPLEAQGPMAHSMPPSASGRFLEANRNPHRVFVTKSKVGHNCFMEPFRGTGRHTEQASGGYTFQMTAMTPPLNGNSLFSLVVVQSRWKPHCCRVATPIIARNNLVVHMC